MSKRHLKHVLVFDTLSNFEQAKLGVQSVVQHLVSKGIQITIVTSEAKHWKTLTSRHTSINLCKLPLPVTSKDRFSLIELSKTIVHFFYCLYFIASRPKVHLLLSYTEPKLSIVIYWLKSCLGYTLVQLLFTRPSDCGINHDCLNTATKVFYLSETQNDGLLATQATTQSCCSYDHWERFTSGLTVANWPTIRKTTDSRFFWAGSLIQGQLAHLLSALDQIKGNVEGAVCYHLPSTRPLAVPATFMPRPYHGIQWYQHCDQIDQVRQQCSIFISTASDESSQLTTLEAMAAGLCLVIPNQAGYWAQALTDGVNCIKFEVDDPHSLAKALHRVYEDPFLRDAIAVEGMKVAENYEAEISYHSIVGYVLATCSSIEELELSHE